MDKSKKPVKLHGLTFEDEDDEEREKGLEQMPAPFVLSCTKKQESEQKIYGCAFDPYIPQRDSQIFACVGSTNLDIYQVPQIDKTLIHSQHYDMPSGEDLYTVCFAFDHYESDQGAFAHRVVAGGLKGTIYVINYEAKTIVNSLTCNGNEIYDLRTKPDDSDFVAAACTDRAIRIFHIRHNACVFFLGGSGTNGHVDNVMAVDWTRDGRQLLSSGKDSRVLCWNLDDECSAIHFRLVSAEVYVEEMNVLSHPFPKRTALKIGRPLPEDSLDLTKMDKRVEQYLELVAGSQEKMNYEEICWNVYNPALANMADHSYMVDCVRSLPDDRILTKVPGGFSRLYYWRFGRIDKDDVQEEPSASEAHTDFVRLADVDIPKGTNWFTKFEVDGWNRFVAIGGTAGNLAFFDLENIQNKWTALTVAGDTVRQTAFSNCGYIAVAVSDDGIVARMDARDDWDRDVERYLVKKAALAKRKKEARESAKKKPKATPSRRSTPKK